MIHPLLRLIVTQPHLLTDHLHAYAELVGEEVGHAKSQFKRRMLWQALAAGLAVMALLLGGMALLLWAAIPVAEMPAPWALLLLPLALALAALACFFAARGNGEPAFANLQRQIAADAALLREAGEA